MKRKESPYASIISPLNFRREETGGKLLMGKVISKTLTTNSFPWTGFICAVAIGQINIQLAFSHKKSLLAFTENI
jgi:hypothetical protein